MSDKIEITFSLCAVFAVTHYVIAELEKETVPQYNVWQHNKQLSSSMLLQYFKDSWALWRKLGFLYRKNA